MFNIKNLIEERRQYPLGLRNDPWKDGLFSRIIADTSDDETAFVGPGGTLFGRKKEALEKKYYIVGVYRIGNIFTNITIPFYVVHLSKKASPGLKIALFNDKCYGSEQRGYERDFFAVPDYYTEQWETFITLLENWMNGGNMPESNEQFEFKFIPKDSMYDERCIPETYSRENTQLRELVAKQDRKTLSELADILFPRIDTKSEEKVKVLQARNLKYPFDLSKIGLGKPSNIILQKGDIVFSRIFFGIEKPFLFNYDGTEQIYASRRLVVIRCRDISPEYLFLYLKSDKAINVLNDCYTSSIFQCLLTRKDIANLLVAIPTEDEQKYISDFNTLTNLGIRDYAQLQRLNTFFKQIHGQKDEKQIVEDILNTEIANNIKAYREDQLRTFLTDDLKELNTCFKGKAYKATLILAGSILEAVLIDWLSELHGKNYFEEDYYITDRNGKEKRAELLNYIDAIKYIRRPRWTAEANKAHLIRKKRNLVHAKLCLQSDDINEDVCRQVISYLTDVLKTRGITSNQ